MDAACGIAVLAPHMSFPGSDPVIVAGAGPVGSTFALFLARQGIPVVLLEKCAQLSRDLRASTFHPPTLDMLARLDLTRELIPLGLIVRTYQYRDRRTGEIANFDLSLLADETSHPYRLQCEQWRLNRLCCQSLAAFDHAQVLFSHEVVGAEADDDGVNVVIHTPEGVKTRHGSYLYGCDGARSNVRKSSGIGYAGFTYPEKFLVVSTPDPLDAALPDLAPVSYLADPEHWCAIVRCGALWRVLIPTRPGESDQEVLSDRYTQERLQSLAPKAGRYEIAHQVFYDVHQRVAERYRKGRILLGGDAAHINNPLGGMGMNGGIHDAINLAEKMVQMRDGNADESVLDLYDRQRRLIAQQFVQQQSIRNKRLLEEKDPAVRAARHAQMMRTARDKELARELLMRTSMIASVRESYAIR